MCFFLAPPLPFFCWNYLYQAYLHAHKSNSAATHPDCHLPYFHTAIIRRRLSIPDSDSMHPDDEPPGLPSSSRYVKANASWDI